LVEDPAGRDVVAVAAFGLFLVGFSLLLSRDVPRVWRGERGRWLPLSGDFFEVTHRSYAVLVAACGGFGVAALLTGLVGMTYEVDDVPRPIAFGLLGLFVLGIGGLALAGVIEATNRPRFLVPPPVRNKPGSISAGRRRRSRARRAQAETEHKLVLLAVESAPGSEVVSPYWIAICDDPDCTWQSNTGDEASARREARRHSSRTPRLERRLVE